jgi:chromate transporter
MPSDTEAPNLTPPAAQPPVKIPPLEILRTFLTLGVLGFGGPRAHLGLMERELVTRRQWIKRESFLDMLAAINLVPGPNSTEMAIHIGLEVGGVRGMLASGFGFIFPAVVFSVALAMITVAAGQVPAVQGFFIGVKPVILVLILSAGYRLARTAINNRAMLGLLIVASLVVLPGVKPIGAAIGWGGLALPELLILVLCGSAYMLVQRPRRLQAASLLFVGIPASIGGVFAAGVASAPLAQGLAPGLAAIGPTLFDLFARFFVIGGTLFGSGLVLASYMQRAFVDGLHWMTPAQVVDSLVIGQSTPGPVLSTVAAAGYLMVNNYANPAPVSAALGIAAGAVSAVGVFMPAFLVILLLGRLVPLLRRSPAAMDFLKGVNAGVIALLFGTFLDLSYATLVRPGADGAALRIDWLTLALTAVFFFASERLRWTALRLVIVGAVIGFIRIALGWV